MKVMRMEAVKFAPGSWEKVGPVLKKLAKLGKTAGHPKVKMYGNISGGEGLHTLYLVTEWPSLAVMEELETKAAKSKGMLEAVEELAEIVDSTEVMLFKELTNKDLGI